MRVFVAVVLSWTALAWNGAVAQERPAEAPAAVVWERTPHPDRYEAAFPTRARQSGLAGGAVLDCEIGDDLGLDCSVRDEGPADHEFGAAAMRVAEGYRAAPVDGDGVGQAGRRVLLHVYFNVPANAHVRRLEPTDDMFWDSGAILDFYPRRARREHVEGEVVLDCEITRMLRYDCDVVSETPEGYRFGRAALDMMENFFLTLEPGEASPAGQRVRFPIRFRDQR